MVETVTIHFVEGKQVPQQKVTKKPTEIIIEETSSNHRVSLEYIENEKVWQATWVNNRGNKRRMRYGGYSNVENVISIVREEADKRFLNS
jgi:hypothetical protein